MRSPKNKYRIEFDYSKPLKGIGSFCSFTTDNVDTSTNVIEHYLQMARQNKVNVTVTIKENTDVYPKFNWKQINKYTQII
jgi:hypothetical protein